MENLQTLKSLPPKQEYFLSVECGENKTTKVRHIKRVNCELMIENKPLTPTLFTKQILEKSLDFNFKENKTINVYMGKDGLLKLISEMEKELIEQSYYIDEEREKLLGNTIDAIKLLWDKEEEYQSTILKIENILNKIMPETDNLIIVEKLNIAADIAFDFSKNENLVSKKIKDNLDKYSQKPLVKVKSLFTRKPNK